MATLASTNLTIEDWIHRRDPDGKAAVLANLLAQTNEIVDDMVLVEGNEAMSHRYTQVTDFPTAYLRAANTGIASSKATTAQATAAMCNIEARSSIDLLVAKQNGDVEGTRRQEDMLFREAMNQKLADLIFYGDPGVDPKEMQGLEVAYSGTPEAASGIGQNILEGSGTTSGALTSIYLIGWGDNTIFCPFSKGTPAGLDYQNLGQQVVENSDGTAYRAYLSWFQWLIGLAIKNWQYGVRIANIEVAELRSLGGDQAPASMVSILHQMLIATYRIPSLSECRPAFYVNRLVHSAMARLVLEKSSSALAWQEAAGQFGTPRRYLTFMGIPIRLCDRLRLTEARET